MSEDVLYSHGQKVRIKLALKYAQMCSLLLDQGIIVVITTISIFDELYAWNHENLTNYFKVYLKVPLDEWSRCLKDKILAKLLLKHSASLICTMCNG